MLSLAVLLIGGYTFKSAESVDIFDSHKECNKWAFEDYQCIENARFMWSSCLSSCTKFAKQIGNDESYEFFQKCKEWAAEGECEANPGFIQLHCPLDCGLSISWDPFTRRDLEFSEIPFEQVIAEDHCADQVSDIISAAEVIKERLNKYISGGYNSVVGFSSSSPSNYLNKMGLAEAVLYVLRLYEVVLASSERQDLLSTTVERIHSVIAVVSSGFSSDLLTRHILEWIDFINLSSYDAHTVASNNAEDGSLYQSQSCQASYGPPLSKVSDHFGIPGSIYTNSTSHTVTLLNGVQMPLMGLDQ